MSVMEMLKRASKQSRFLSLHAKPVLKQVKAADLHMTKLQKGRVTPGPRSYKALILSHCHSASGTTASAGIAVCCLCGLRPTAGSCALPVPE